MTSGGTKISSMDRVRHSAERLGLEINIRRMEGSTRTAGEAASQCGCDVAQIVKSLIFESQHDGSLILFLVSGRNTLDLDYISESYGLRLKRCDTRRVRRETGFAIGGVAPIGHVNPIPIYADRCLLDFDTVWAAAGRPDSVFSVNPEALGKGRSRSSH